MGAFPGTPYHALIGTNARLEQKVKGWEGVTADTLLEEHLLYAHFSAVSSQGLIIHKWCALFPLKCRTSQNALMTICLTRTATVNQRSQVTPKPILKFAVCVTQKQQYEYAATIMATTSDGKIPAVDTIKSEDVYKDDEEVEVWDKETDVEVAEGIAVRRRGGASKEQSCERKSITDRNHSPTHSTNTFSYTYRIVKRMIAVKAWKSHSRETRRRVLTALWKEPIHPTFP